MSQEEIDVVEENSSAIPLPDISTENEPTEEQIKLDDLKHRATTLGIKYHPSIGTDKLREKIQAVLADNAAEVVPEGDTKNVSTSLAELKAETLKLIRVRITCMDPMKKNYQGDFFLTGNSLVGTVKRFVPYGVEWHVPQIILNMIQEKKYQQFSTSKNSRNVDITTSKLVKTYGVELLAPLTQEQIKELGRVQAMKRGEATD